MPDVCPHCGAKLPPIRDAFCPSCRGDLDEAPVKPVPSRSDRFREWRETLAVDIWYATEERVFAWLKWLWYSDRGSLRAREQRVLFLGSKCQLHYGPNHQREPRWTGNPLGRSHVFGPWQRVHDLDGKGVVFQLPNFRKPDHLPLARNSGLVRHRLLADILAESRVPGRRRSSETGLFHFCNHAGALAWGSKACVRSPTGAQETTTMMLIGMMENHAVADCSN
jgi:hypothetical protein